MVNASQSALNLERFHASPRNVGFAVAERQAAVLEAISQRGADDDEDDDASSDTQLRINRESRCREKAVRQEKMKSSGTPML